jgi:hypothetical protein
VSALEALGLGALGGLAVVAVAAVAGGVALDRILRGRWP